MGVRFRKRRSFLRWDGGYIRKGFIRKAPVENLPFAQLVGDENITKRLVSVLYFDFAYL